MKKNSFVANCTRRRVLTTSVAALVGAAGLAAGWRAAATDGSWIQVGNGTQLWSATTNWNGGTIAGGQGASAVFNTNITADQTIQLDATGRTVGYIFVQDPTTATAGGFALGNLTGDGPITLDVASGDAVIDIGSLAANKKFAIQVPIISDDPILKVNTGELSIRADSPGVTSDLIIAGGALNSTRSYLGSLRSLQITNSSTFTVDFASNTANVLADLVNPSAPLVLGGNVATPTVPAAGAAPVSPNIFNASVSGSGNLVVNEKGTSFNSQTFASTTLNAGSHTITVTSNAGGSATIQLGTITRQESAGLNLVASGGTGTIIIGNSNDAATGILGPWVVYNSATWAISNGGFVGGLDPTAYSNTWAAGANTDVTASLTGVSGHTSTLRFNTAGALSVTLASPSIVDTGGILNSAAVGANASTITGGSLTSGTNELLLNQYNTTAGGTLTIASPIVDNGAPVSVVKLGGGTVVLNGGSTYTGTTKVYGGTLDFEGDNSGLTGLINVVSNQITVGATGVVGSTGLLAAPIALSPISIISKTGTGTFTVSGTVTGGALSISTGELIVTGNNATTLTQQTNIGAAGILGVGNDLALGSGPVRINSVGATLTSADANPHTLSNFLDFANNGNFGLAGTGALTFAGGSFALGNAAKVFTQGNDLMVINEAITGGPATATVTKAGVGTLAITNNTSTYVRPWVVTSGTLQIGAEQALGTAPGTLNAGHLTLNGGILQTTATFAIDDTNRGVTIGAGGGTFNTNAGTILTIANALTGSAATLTKTGTGTLLLSGANIFSGTMAANAGTLITTPSQTGTTNITVADGATFGVNLSTAGLSFNTTGGGLTTNGATTGATVQIGSGSTGNPTIAALNVGAFTVATPTVIKLTGSALTEADHIPLISYSSIGGTGFAGLSLSLPARYVGMLEDNSASHEVDLLLSTVQGIRWTGATNGDWDLDPTGQGAVGTPNWITTKTNVPTRFWQGSGGTDTANFDDNATGPTTVNLKAVLTPVAVNVNNSVKDYTFAGTGTLTGNTSLTKLGSRTLTLANTVAYDYTGGTLINGGTLQIGDGVTAGAGLLPTAGLTNNATLAFNRPDDFAVAVPITGTGTISKLAGNTVSFTNSFTTAGALAISAGTLQFANGGALSGVISGAGKLALSAGTLALTGTTSNTLTGDTVVTGGTLQLNHTTSNSIGGNLLISGGAVTWSAADQVADTSSITVNSGTFATGNRADTVANVTVNSTQLSTLSGLNITGTLTITAGTQDLANSAGAITVGTAIFSGGSIVRLGANSGTSTLVVGAGGLSLTDSNLQFGQVGGTAFTAQLLLGGDVTAAGTSIFDVNTGNPISKIDLGTATRTFNVTSGVTSVEPSIVSATATSGITKTGAGSLVLVAGANSNGVSTYTGPTTVTAGSLIVMGSLNGTSEVDISGTGTLGGSGTIIPAVSGNIKLLAGGKLSPGSGGVGTLVATLNGGTFDLSAAVAPSNSQALVFDLAATSDAVVLSGGPLQIGANALEFNDFNFVPQATFAAGTDYILFASDQAIAGTLGSNLSGAIGSFNGTLQLAAGNTELVLHVIPEPASGGLLIFSALGLAAMRRRRPR